MKSFIPSLKIEILNMIFQNKLNQTMKITPSHSAYDSKLITILFNEKLFNLGFKIEFQKENLQN